MSRPFLPCRSCARDYPQPDTQKPGLGFPLARIAAVFSLACGAVLEVGICRYAGKGQSELGMLRTLWDLFLPGDVMLADLDVEQIVDSCANALLVEILRPGRFVRIR